MPLILFPHLYSVFYTGSNLSVRIICLNYLFLIGLETHDQAVVLGTIDEESLGTKIHRNEAAADRGCTASVGKYDM